MLIVVIDHYYTDITKMHKNNACKMLASTNDTLNTYYTILYTSIGIYMYKNSLNIFILFLRSSLPEIKIKKLSFSPR